MFWVTWTFKINFVDCSPVWNRWSYTFQICQWPWQMFTAMVTWLHTFLPICETSAAVATSNKFLPTFVLLCSTMLLTVCTEQWAKDYRHILEDFEMDNILFCASFIADYRIIFWLETSAAQCCTNLTDYKYKLPDIYHLRHTDAVSNVKHAKSLPAERSSSMMTMTIKWQ